MTIERVNNLKNKNTQLSAIIAQSNMIWYGIYNCSDWGKI